MFARRKFLYNYTDAAALEVVAKVIGQRALQTGVSEVCLKVEEEDLKKERMRKFVEAVEASGLTLSENLPFVPTDPHRGLSAWKDRVRPWEFVDE